MFELLKALKKVGIQAESKLFQFASYFDGQQHDFSFPCAVVLVPGDMNGHDTAAMLEKLEKIERKHGYSTYSKNFDPFDGFHLVLIRNDHIEEGRKGYSESIAFQTGFWMKYHENKNASDKELIQAGHDEMIKHGYKIRIAA
jgi:hypothetical protein